MVFKQSDSMGMTFAKGAAVGGAVGLAIGLLRPKTPVWATALAAAGAVLALKAL